MQDSFGTMEFRNGAGAPSTALRLVDGALNLGWHHCAATADFLGGFFALPGLPDAGRNDEVRHSIGYLVNELLENAIKFRAPGDIVIESSLDGGRFEIRVINRIDGDTADRFRGLLGEITTRDPGELLLERIEANAADPSSGASGLGLLTLMNDYGAQMLWRFRPQDSGSGVVLETGAALTLA